MRPFGLLGSNLWAILATNNVSTTRPISAAANMSVAASTSVGHGEKPATGTAAKRWAPKIFSFPAMCMFLLGAVIFALSVKQFADPDIWWHLRTAQDLLQHHSFAPIDTYSFTAAGTPRMNYEWLSEIPYFLAY